MASSNRLHAVVCGKSVDFSFLLHSATMILPNGTLIPPGWLPTSGLPRARIYFADQGYSFVTVLYSRCDYEKID